MFLRLDVALAKQIVFYVLQTNVRLGFGFVTAPGSAS